MVADPLRGPGTIRSEFDAELDAAIAKMDRRTVAYREMLAVRQVAGQEVLRVALEADEAVREAHREAQAQSRRADAANREANAAKEALQLRQSGGERAGESVTISMPRGANGRDWTVDELEEACFRFRVAGLGGADRLELRSDRITGWIPTGSELPPSKAELAMQAEAEVAARVERRRKLAKRAVVAVPVSMVGIPVAMVCVVLFKLAVTALWSLL